MALTLWKPLGGISRFDQDVDGWIDRLFGSPFFEHRSSQLIPALDVFEDDKSIRVKMDLPGVDEKDISITLADGTLAIKGEKNLEK